jgi:uncharacterized protein with HEPN domain
MKDVKQNDLFRLRTMLEAMASIEARLALGFSEQVVKESIAFHLMSLGEAVSKLSKELKEKHSDIPWNDIAGTRHKIVHEYYRIDYDLVEAIVYGKLPDLSKQIEAIIGEMRA